MNRVAVMLLSLIYGWVVVLVMVFRIIGQGKRFFVVRNRDTPPPCLLDPNLGRHSYIKLKEVKLHYVSCGDESKTLMIMIHGFPDFWFSWRHQLREFSREYWVIAVDLRGYGESDKPDGIDAYHCDKIVEDLRELIYALGRENAVIMGHDWGGLLSFTLAARYPEIVSKLIIANAPHPSALTEVIKSSWKQFLNSWYFFFFQLPYLPEIMFRSDDLNLLERLLQAMKNKPCSDEEIEVYKYIFSRHLAWSPPINYYRANSAILSNNLVSRVVVPTLLIWGAHDTALHILTATTTSKYVDNFNLRVVENANHWVHVDNPEQFNQHAWQFLRLSQNVK